MFKNFSNSLTAYRWVGVKGLYLLLYSIAFTFRTLLLSHLNKVKPYNMLYFLYIHQILYYNNIDKR